MKKSILDARIPNFFDGFYDSDIERPHTLGAALNNFESVVENIKNLTIGMRISNFDPQDCAMILDLFYGGDMTENDMYPSEYDNYYYVLTMPELLDIELALEILDIHKGPTWQKINKLKRELWQLLPDFYRGHAKPMPQPLTYDPHKPYPYSCVEGSLVKARWQKLGQWGSGLDYDQKYSKYMPKDDAKPTTISFKEGDVMINGKIASTDIHATVMEPFNEMLSFAEDVISNRDPTFFSIDPEGPPIEFCTNKTGSPAEVKLVVYHYFEGRMQGAETTTILSAILNRRQLAECFIEECEQKIKDIAYIAKNNLELGYYGDPRTEYVKKLGASIQRLKSII